MARRVSKVCYRLNMWYPSSFCSGFPGGSVVKNPPITAGDTGDVCLISGSGRSPEGRNGNPLQYSCQDNPMDRGAWWAIHFMGLQRAGHDWGIKGENAVISSTAISAVPNIFGTRNWFHWKTIFSGMEDGRHMFQVEKGAMGSRKWS